MIKELWNVGLKVIDLDREVAFLREVGARLVLRERVPLAGEEREYAILVLGGVRMLLFETCGDRVERRRGGGGDRGQR